VLPAVAENNQGPLRWKMQWIQQGDRLVTAQFKSELVSGELTASETLALQKQLRSLLAALSKEASFTIPP
jgi:hypothetical protein